MLTKQDVMNALSTVMDPDLGQDLVTLGMIEDLQVEGEKVSFSVVLTTPACPLKRKIENDCRTAVLSMTGAKEVEINMTARVRGQQKVDLGDNCFKHVIAVSSGKGGVGKSTVSVALASALAADGAKVGLLDADIYGPNVPRMLGIDELPPMQEGQKPDPAEINGMKVLSIGFLVSEGQPLIWRGPMLHNAIQQFLTDFNWGELDYLIIDMPPGTGDVQLSVAQTLPIGGAVIVTTPQQVAVDDASRAISMFHKLDVPVLGIVENMAFLPMPDGEKLYLFGEAGGENLARRAGVLLLGRIPIDPGLGKGGDIGSPIFSEDKAEATRDALRDMARKTAAAMSTVAHAARTG